MGDMGVIDRQFWKGRRVFLTGHTGFKGSWLSLWLHQLGAEVTGFSLEAPTSPSMFHVCSVNNYVHSVYADIRDPKRLIEAMIDARAEVVIHMAAQPLLRESYRNPIETYSTNVMGTVHLFEAARACGSVKAIVNVTTDKCYENKEWDWPYRENDALGGYDPYSSSKACSELITSAFRSSFFNPSGYTEHGVAVASARAGNVIGGGDWAQDRLIPDALKAFQEQRPVSIRNPNAIRPWQHVLEPLSGYLILAQRLYLSGTTYGEGWNFGPEETDAKSVQWIVSKLCEKWGNGAAFEIVADSEKLHEANYLKLDCSKSKRRLGWIPQWTLEEAIDKICDWSNAYANSEDLVKLSFGQIEEYQQRMDKGAMQ
ncbi:CDP-glucose 4,6-dehydratase [Cohnella abietis]|uniref:CDP-glucose 4,6-dehydratase n=2 Tax=Cohnella abietis TaxID=2507935 RepID=A0A3T1DDG3_9BACL|nr:CDP-glucose 4,6-dehydratase [Cohnella abietis]